MMRRIQLLVVTGVLLVAAFSTGAEFLFFLVYLGLLVVGGSYLMTRFGLADLEAGFALDRTQAQVGDTLRATYTLRNSGRLPKLWLETHNPSTLPVPLPGRALALPPRAERSWVGRVPLVQRGHFHVDALHVRTGDPFGLFEAAATVGSPANVTVYPRVEPLPRWRVPSASLEGSHASRERTLQSTPLVTSIRPYVPGDAFNRIHWKSSARQQELQVKEFDLEQTADAWVFLDLERGVHTGSGEESTLEAGVRVAAAVSERALGDNRAVGFTAAGGGVPALPADRGVRQHHKIMGLLASVAADGDVPLVEALVAGLPRLRRGMTAIVVTPSVSRDWVRPLAGLRSRGVATVVCLLDALAYDAWTRRVESRMPTVPRADVLPSLDQAHIDELVRGQRAIRHAIAEYELTAHVVVPGRPLGELLVSRGLERSKVPT